MVGDLACLAAQQCFDVVQRHLKKAPDDDARAAIACTAACQLAAMAGAFMGPPRSTLADATDEERLLAALRGIDHMRLIVLDEVAARGRP